MKTLQYLAEDATNEDQSSRSFTNIASAVIQDLFKPSDSYSVNEQVTVLFQAMGWKNAQIKLTSANEANILLGSNRHLDQDPNSESALKLLVGTISKALGYHVLDREIDAVVDIDIHNGPIYSIDIKAIKARKPGEEEVKKPKPKEQIPAKPIQRMESPATSTTELTPTFDTSQLFLPILSNKLPIGRLHLMLQDVLVEFSQSWYGTNPIEETSSSDERENVVTLITYLVQQSIDRGSSPVDTGTRLGTFFGHAITQNFNARAFCSLNPGEKCGPNIGNANRALCDFSMGLWQGCLTELGEKDYTFTGFYTAGKRDPYCLMEFSAK
jgi:hypothetical protein